MSSSGDALSYVLAAKPLPKPLQKVLYVQASIKGRIDEEDEVDS